jgi:hypothetical protein
MREGNTSASQSKAEPGYDSERDMNHLLSPLAQQPPFLPFINSSNLLCHPNQRKPVQSDKWPRVQAKTGGWVSLRYAENGHKKRKKRKSLWTRWVVSC